MATYYIDPDNGSDAAAGTSFALAWKTVTSGATAARIAPGDTIRLKASPLPTSVGNATWTNTSSTVTLASACTQTINLCESSWTSDSVDVTCATDTSLRKEGNSSAKFTIAAGFTTGLMAHIATGTLDLSAYEQVSFWVAVNATSLASGVLELRLCSDTTGTTVVDTITIPAMAGVSWWHAYTVARTGGGTLGANIQSIALYANSDPGTVQVNLDCIIACKASSSADSLTLNSLIGKNTGDGWYPIASIVGTTVKIDNDTPRLPTQLRGYAGATGTVTTYKRECFAITTITGTTTTAHATVLDSGTGGSYIHYSGGWNRTDMSTQETGENAFSFFNGFNGLGIGFKVDGRSAIIIENIGITRCYNAFTFNSTSISDKLLHSIATGCSSDAITSSGFGFYVDDVQSLNSGGRGFLINAAGSVNLTDVVVNSHYNNAGMSFTNSGAIGKNIIARNNASYGLTFITCSVTIDSLVTESNVVSGIYGASGHENYVTNWTASESTEVTLHSSGLSGFTIFSTNHDATDGNHIQFFDGGRVSSETGADRRTASGIAWKLSPTNAYRDTTFPVKTQIATIAVTVGVLTTVKAWMKRDNLGVTGRLFICGCQLGGPLTDISATTSGAAGSYEELTVSWTPSTSGVVEVEAHAYGGTTYNVFVDDMTFL